MRRREDHPDDAPSLRPPAGVGQPYGGDALPSAVQPSTAIPRGALFLTGMNPILSVHREMSPEPEPPESIAVSASAPYPRRSGPANSRSN